jgi:hypothetical protein
VRIGAVGGTRSPAHLSRAIRYHCHFLFKVLTMRKLLALVLLLGCQCLIGCTIDPAYLKQRAAVAEERDSEGITGSRLPKRDGSAQPVAGIARKDYDGEHRGIANQVSGKGN